MGQTAETYYRQCLLARGSARQHAWIPEALAANHAPVSLHGEEGWTIEHVSTIRRSESELNAQEHSRRQLHAVLA